MGLLDKGKIRRAVKSCEKEYGYLNEVIYRRCIDDIKKIKNLENIDDNKMRGPIWVFLIKWGSMIRFLGKIENKDTWEKKIKKIIRKKRDKLENFRKLCLENADIDKLKEDIEDCYGEFKKAIKPVSASKTLHLICPSFFPMWDSHIKSLINTRSVKGEKISLGKSEDYFKFVKKIKNIIEQQNDLLSELSQEYKRSKVRIVEECLWFMGKNAKQNETKK